MNSPSVTITSVSGSLALDRPDDHALDHHPADERDGQRDQQREPERQPGLRRAPRRRRCENIAISPWAKLTIPVER